MSASAADTYRIERIEPTSTKKWGSTVIAWIVALFTFGGGTTPIVGAGVRILDREGETLAEHHDGADSMLATFESASHDLAELSAEEFASRWIPGSPS